MFSENNLLLQYADSYEIRLTEAHWAATVGFSLCFTLFVCFPELAFINNILMKNFFVLIIAIVAGTIANAQNLVIDPGFEQTANGCSGFPFPVEGMSDLVHWDNISNSTPADTCTTPDLFSTCNTGMVGMFTGVPSNFMGNQCPKTGEKYAGIITYDIGSSYREYLQGALSAPMQAGQTYCVSFYVSLGDVIPFASNNIGVHFSNTHQVWSPPCGGPWSPPNLTPQLNYTCVLTDTEWVRLQWDYVATGGEQYIIIGNFYNNGATTTSTTGQTSLNPFAYYYVDDVSVTPGSCCYTEIRAPGATDCDVWQTTNSGSNITASFCISDGPADFELLTPVDGSTCSVSQPSVTGTWSGPGITNTTTGTFSPSVAGVGTHTITFTASCGYVATAQVIVSPCNLQVCVESDGSLTASGGAGPYTWENQITAQDCSSCFVGCVLPPGCAVNVLQWTTFATGTTIPAPSGYPVQVTDAGGNTLLINNASSLPSCDADPCAGVTISAGVTPVHVSCNASGSATANPSGGTAPYTYSWNTSPVQTTQTATNLAAGNYTVTVTDANGCTGTQTVTINPSPQGLTVTISSTDVTCNAGGSATANPSGGTAPYTYSWNTSPVQTTQTATNLTAGNYAVTVTDANGCTGTQTVTINPSSQGLTATVSSTDVMCNGEATGTATALVSGGTPPYTYNWSSGGTTASISDLSPGTYTVTVTDAAGCTSQESVQIDEPSVIALSTSSTPSQCTANDGTATVVASGGTAPYTYSWSPSGGTGATTTPVGQGNYTVIVTDANGCEESVGVSVGGLNAPDPLVVNVQNATCFGNADGSAEVSASGGTAPYTYSWTPSGGTASTASNLQAGTYTVAVTDNAGCTGYVQVVITQPDALIVSENVVHATCGASDGEISLMVSGGNGGYVFTWNPNVSTTSTASNLPAGVYDILVTDGSGCSSGISAEVENSVGFYLEATPETTLIDLGGSVGLTLDVEPGIIVDHITWTPPDGLSCTDCTDPVASPVVTTTYVVAVTSTDGCVSYDTVTVMVRQPCGEIFVPTIFSPNEDGLNDLECVMGGCIVSLDFTIYNRWGEVVFTSDNQSDCWDGTFRGKPVQTGVYVYKLKATISTGESISQSGNINVTR